MINSSLTLPRLFTPQKAVTLSTYFPAGSQFFYGYPAGMDSGFLNHVPPVIEELVAARPICCAGEDIAIIGFAATDASQLDSNLLKRLRVPRLPYEQTITLPPEINCQLEGQDRNMAIKSALKHIARADSLIMAQPYIDDDMDGLFQIPPELSIWLNDKANMTAYLDKEAMPERLGVYDSGAAFAADIPANLTLPVVVKAAASSSGDGVFICHTQADLRAAAKSLREVTATIFIEQFVVARKNFGLHFAIPYDKLQPIDILGINEQLTSPEGEFLGGIIRQVDVPPELEGSVQYLLASVLPKIRAMGWYGIGCFDVLSDGGGQHYFIDCNFRMTGMSAYHFLIANGTISRPLISFSGQFTGTAHELETTLSPYITGGSSQVLQLIALSNHEDTWNFNAALMYATPAELLMTIRILLKAGVSSAALSSIAQGGVAV